MDNLTNSRERGAALLRDGRAHEAIEALREATAQSPADTMAWRLLGGALAQTSRPTEALAAFEQAAILQPDAAKNQYNVALTLMTLERRTEARERLERALALDPGYEQARLRLSELGGSTSPPPLPPLTPPVPEPPLVTLGGGTEGIAPPPLSASRYDRPGGPPVSPVNGTVPLVLGILGIVLCGLLAPVAWVLGDNALRALDTTPHLDQSQRGTALAGKVLGIIGTVLMILLFLGFAVLGVIGALADNKS
jgi:tetratricopeptide (TPR) repeat protein